MKRITLYEAFNLDIFTGREQPHTFYRHAVRKWYKSKGYSYHMIADLEGKATGKRPHHTTIIHSIKQCDEVYFARAVLKAYGLGIKP
jgi:hypothetical protein